MVQFKLSIAIILAAAFSFILPVVAVPVPGKFMSWFKPGKKDLTVQPVHHENPSVPTREILNQMAHSQDIMEDHKKAIGMRSYLINAYRSLPESSRHLREPEIRTQEVEKARLQEVLEKHGQKMHGYGKEIAERHKGTLSTAHQENLSNVPTREILDRMEHSQKTMEIHKLGHDSITRLKRFIPKDNAPLLREHEELIANSHKVVAEHGQKMHEYGTEIANRHKP